MSRVFTPSSDDWLRAVRRMVMLVPHTRELGVEVVAAGPDGVRFRLPWRTDLLGDSTRGLVHGGALTMLLDTVCGAAVLPALPSPEVCPTLDLRVDHYRPALEGQAIIAEARAVSVSASVVFTEGLVWQTRSQPVARGIANFVRLGMRNTPPGFAEALFASDDVEEGGHD
ncbi:PaaI family thioesterase [Halomonas halocynthiae]|uniref:PaaI family thioesterase n=1 Tax=Halomonas halocynthiae TaxID=176290 RepID=UPI0004284C10|nr:PaaI family thioesterase [Halomonas halocynthiae]